MTGYKLYPNLPSAPPETPQVAYAELGPSGANNLNVIQANRRVLINKEQMFKKKYEKYTKILNQLVWLNACSSGISIATGISSVATFSTFIGLPVSILLGAASLTGAIASGIISALTKKYKQKLKKVTKLIDIIMPALVVFERVVSGALKNGIINEEEFNMLQTLHLKTLNELMGIDHRMEAEHRSLVEKSLLEEINNIKKNAETKKLFALCVMLRVTLKMDKIYYQRNHLWKGQKAVKKLKEYSKEKPKMIKQWLSRQAFWQVHLPAPKRINRPHYQVTIPNEMHQFDLLYMPSDTLYRNKYKYILAGIDATSRYKVVRPLRTKQAHDVAEMIADIYKVRSLTYSKIFQHDNGSEFKAGVTKMLEKHEVKIQRVTTKYKHTHTAFVKALNKILAERLFKVLDAQELNDPDVISATLIKHLYGLVDELNNTTTEMIGMKPKDAIKLEQVPLVKQENYPEEDKLPDYGLYQYLLRPGEEHDNQQCRATDRLWSKGTYRLREVVKDPGNRVIYYLSEGPKGPTSSGPERAFVSEELMLIPEDTELPPDYVRNW